MESKWVEAGLALLVLVAFFRRSLMSSVLRMLSGSGEKHSLQSEVHGLLECAVKQNSTILDIRDSARRQESSHQIHNQAILGALSNLCQSVDMLLSPLLAAANPPPTRINPEQWELSIALIGQIRDYAQGLSAVAPSIQEMQQGAVEFDSSWKITARAIKASLDGIAAALRAPEEVSKQAAAQAVILGKILEQLEKNDQRLADFVGASRRIMRAIEGNADGDEDTVLFEEAKLIQERALAKDVILTAEDALKRAREQRNWART